MLEEEPAGVSDDDNIIEMEEQEEIEI